ncbi:4-hydroxybenzoate polyprenyltransferase [Thalassolituus oleivorans]|uniref:4-hydroxybenzoate octaprenyltransferase n=1 Tax=Thalassolituus oleivorans TaxID=187493 RepID=UPI0009492704|nr:4-hydroxybenzoate octaprenyltransferase [Thalassolituus oleivorans]APR65692.1 4-hydroxybenzoate polyprenyltransferase [Thalassolituus oleivorans]
MLVSLGIILINTTVITQQLDNLWPAWRAWVAITRLDKPIGSYLLLWPTLWALWVAAEGVADFSNIIIFVIGVFLMRSAGCVINDIADRKVDGHVERTKDRPLATGMLSTKHAVIGFVVLCALAFGLVLFTNTLTIYLSFAGAALAAIYPFMKRHTHLPQVFLGAAFSWAIPMAFAAQADALPPVVWLLYAANLVWTVAYDTLYAMVDRDCDIKIGVKSTAILFGELDLFMIGLLQVLNLMCLWLAAGQLALSWAFYLALALGALFLAWQLWNVRSRSREDCFTEFRRSHWFGLIIWLGLVGHYALES